MRPFFVYQEMKKLYFFLGTTAELIKVAPIIRELKNRNADFKIIASNQNTLEFGELEPLIGKQSADYTFKLKPFKYPRNIYLRFLVWSVKSINNYLLYFRNEFKGENRKNSLFIVHGDTVTSLMGAIVAKICRVKLIHIESGLRSFSFLEPFPEEFCRFVISYLTDIHFCPNKWALNNLKKHRGIKINTIYNTVGESLELALKGKKGFVLNIPRDKRSFLSHSKKYFILILHRQEHTLFNKKSSRRIIELMLKEAKDNLKCVFIMHRLTKDFLKKHGLSQKVKRNANVILPPRLPYLSFVKLMKNAEFIATDGGTNQEENYYMGKPCLMLRNRTERIEGLGENAVLSHDSKTMIRDFLKNYTKYRRKPIKIKIRPSKIIADYLLDV